MKTFEELSFKNVAIIEKYLSGNMSAKEKEAFRSRLREDDDLKEDYDMLKDSVLQYREAAQEERIYQKLSRFDTNATRVQRKRKVGLGITKNGFMAFVAMVLMVLVCALLIAVAS